MRIFRVDCVQYHFKQNRLTIPLLKYSGSEVNRLITPHYRREIDTSFQGKDFAT